jgi:hypothetical protein
LEGDYLMAITISGSGITSANIADGTIVNTDVADVAASKLTGALPAIDGSALTGLGGGITMVDQWKLTAIKTANGTLTDLARPTWPGFGRIGGTGMSVASGIFTFPSTGIYAIYSKLVWNINGSDTCDSSTYLTTDNSNYTSIDYVTDGMNGSGARNSSSMGAVIVDVTDVSQVKMYFTVGSLGGGSSIVGDTSSYNLTSFTFIRLGDTQ